MTAAAAPTSSGRARLADALAAAIDSLPEQDRLLLANVVRLGAWETSVRRSIDLATLRSHLRRIGSTIADAIEADTI